MEERGGQILESVLKAYPTLLLSSLAMRGCVHALAPFRKQDAERKKGLSASMVQSLQHSSTSCHVVVHLQDLKPGDVMERHAEACCCHQPLLNVVEEYICDTSEKCSAC